MVLISIYCKSKVAPVAGVQENVMLTKESVVQVWPTSRFKTAGSGGNSGSGAGGVVVGGGSGGGWVGVPLSVVQSLATLVEPTVCGI